MPDTRSVITKAELISLLGKEIPERTIDLILGALNEVPPENALAKLYEMAPKIKEAALMGSIKGISFVSGKIKVTLPSAEFMDAIRSAERRMLRSPENAE